MEEMYSALRGHLLARLGALLQIRDYTSEGSVCRPAGVQFTSTVNSGHLSDLHGLVIVQIKEDVSVFTVVDLGRILPLD